MSRILFGILLVVVAILYVWLSVREVAPGLGAGNWVSYVGAVLFLAALVGAAMAGLNLVRAKRR